MSHTFLSCAIEKREYHAPAAFSQSKSTGTNGISGWVQAGASQNRVTEKMNAVCATSGTGVQICSRLVY